MRAHRASIGLAFRNHGRSPGPIPLRKFAGHRSSRHFTIEGGSIGTVPVNTSVRHLVMIAERDKKPTVQPHFVTVATMPEHASIICTSPNPYIRREPPFQARARLQGEMAGTAGRLPAPHCRANRPK